MSHPAGGARRRPAPGRGPTDAMIGRRGGRLGRVLFSDPVPQPATTEESGKPAAGRRPSTHETALLLTLAAIQFTHAVDFMVMMPLGPQFMRLFGIGPQAFGLLVSIYTLSAAASGFMAAFWVDRVDRKRALLGLYAGFAVATALCAFAPDYPRLLAARFVAGAFGGVIGGLVFAAVADLVPWARRAKAMAVVSAAFSLAAVAGIPLSLWLAAHLSWRAPFVALALTSVVIGLVALRILPPMRAHVAIGGARRPWRQFRAIFGERNHLRAFAMMIALTFAGFSVIPFVAAYNVANVGVAEQDLAVIYFAGGLATLVSSQAIGWLADRHGKRRVFSVVALLSIGPILLTTHLPPLPLPAVVAAAVLFFVFVTGRFGPAMALVTGSVSPDLRGSFMSFNASVQQLGSGIASLVAGWIIGRASDGALTHYGTVGWIAAAATLLAIALARRIRIVDADDA
jgi:predicted MFS family arabinose efflux permease